MGIRSCLHQHGTTIESVPWCKSYSPVLLQPFICQPSCKPYPPVPLQPFVCHGWALVVTDYEGYEGEEGPPLNQFVTPAVLSHLAATTSLTRLVFQRPLDEPPKRREEEVKGWCQHIAQLQQLRHLEFGGEYALGGSARCLARLTQLTYLCISNSQLPDRVAVAFGCALKCLVTLDMSGNEDLSDACAPALAQLTGLTSLRFAYLPGIARTEYSEKAAVLGGG